MLDRPILIMAGGTGGHIYPALAIAELIRARNIPVLWLGTRHGLEYEVVPKAGYPLATIAIQGLRGNGFWRWLCAPLAASWALLQALSILRCHRPIAALGVGGFISGPGGVAAYLLRIPLFIHEQNTIAGLTNRLLAPLAHTVFSSFPDVFAARYKSRIVGTPVRAALFATPPPEQRLPDKLSALKVLVLGGSQGALALNRRLPAAFADCCDLPLLIKHQTGKRHLDATRADYCARDLNAEIVPFIEDMASAYAWADVVFCRSGALTIAELSAVGVAAVLVPFPYAVDDHQTKNAAYLVEQGAAILIPETALTKARINALLQQFWQAPDKLREMACRARALHTIAQPQAAKHVAQVCLEVIHAD